MTYRKSLSIGVSAIVISLLLFLPAFVWADAGTALTEINPEYLVTPDEAYQWHSVKDKLGPTYSGNESWQNMMAFLEEKLKEYGVKDLKRNAWTYDRFVTTEWPDDSGWSLSIGGKSVKVANYGAYSGFTAPEGVTAPLVIYTPKTPLESMKGKIVVFMTMPHPKPPLGDDYKTWFTMNDYEYRNEKDEFPELYTQISVSESVAYDVWWQLRQTIMVYKVMLKSQAAGGLVIFNMPYDRAAGLYTFPVMPMGKAPILYLDRVNGKEVLAAAKEGREAVVRLEGKLLPTETYQLIGFLPGKNYGTPGDKMIMLRTHTDGPAIAQDNGALGILGIVGYMSKIPQAERPKTLMLYFDNRHYMPGMEKAFAKQDYFTLTPEALKPVKGLVAVEHLGQVEYREVGDKYEPTGRIEPSFLWTRADDKLANMAAKAVKDHQLPRVMVQCVERPGKHGGPQGVWYGMGRVAMEWNLPAFATMGIQGAYWATTARLDNAFDKDHFVKQVAVMSQLTGELMKMGE